MNINFGILSIIQPVHINYVVLLLYFIYINFLILDLIPEINSLNALGIELIKFE